MEQDQIELNKKLYLEMIGSVNEPEEKVPEDEEATSLAGLEGEILAPPLLVMRLGGEVDRRAAGGGAGVLAGGAPAERARRC